MQTRSSDENSVCPSVKCVICGKTKEGCVRIFISYERSLSLVFQEEEWLVGATPSTWNFGSTGPCWSKIADSEPKFTRSDSAITPSKNAINTNRKSTTLFAISPRWSSYIALTAPKGLKTQNGRFQCKITLQLKEVSYKVSLCENCQRQGCNAFIGLYICAKMFGGYVPFYLKIWQILTHPLAKRRFPIYFRS